MVCDEFEGKSGCRRLVTLSELLHPELRPDHYVEDILMWEAHIRDYENSTSKLFDDDLRVAVVLFTAPEHLQTHLMLNISALGEDYQSIRAVVVSYFKVASLAANGSGLPSPMDVDVLGAR